MFNLKLSTKISILAAASIIISSVAVGIISTNVSSSEITNLTLENLETTELGVMDTLDQWRQQLQLDTLVLADKTRLAAALDTGDFDTADTLTVEQKKTS